MRTFSSPFSLLGPPLLLAASIPLAILATITTTIAITALAVRMSIVYFELGVALSRGYLFPTKSKTAGNYLSTHRAPPHRTRNRVNSNASSIASNTSLRDIAITPVIRMGPNKSASFVSLIGTSKITRDFESVGGWRISNGDDEDAIWTGLNSRLELPAVLPNRNHRRSLTGGSIGQRLSWSPVHSRARTPYSEDMHVGGGYFPLQKSASGIWPKSMHESRRQSASGSSMSSGGPGSRRDSVTLEKLGE